MSLHFSDKSNFQENISPFNIHPDINTLYNLCVFGYCFVIHNGSDKSILKEFCKNSNMTENDFERVYIYYGCYIYKTEKQLDFKNNLELFFKNIENSNWNLNTMVYIPVDKIIL